MEPEDAMQGDVKPNNGVSLLRPPFRSRVGPLSPSVVLSRLSSTLRRSSTRRCRDRTGRTWARRDRRLAGRRIGVRIGAEGEKSGLRTLRVREWTPAAEWTDVLCF